MGGVPTGAGLVDGGRPRALIPGKAERRVGAAGLVDGEAGQGLGGADSVSCIDRV